MNIRVFRITPTDNVRVETSAKTLDEVTRVLPQGFYTTFSTSAQGTRALGLRSHLQRLYAPARELRLRPPVDEKNLRERIALLVKENLPQESRARLILTKDAGELYLGIQPFTPLPEAVYAAGVRTLTAPILRHDPRIKDTGFISESAGQRKLLGADVFEVLLTRDGKIFEGMTSNFYAVTSRPAKLVTARRGILLGVTRRVILRLARGRGLEIEYRAPGMDEKFDEAFLTSSSRGVVPIVAINGKPVGRGKVGEWTKILMQAYWDYAEQSSERIF